MTAESIITYLQGVGAVLSVEDGTLRIEAKKGTIKPDQVEQLKAHKAEIISLLQPEKKPAQFNWHSCEECGSTIYIIAEAWEMVEIPASSPWTYSHKPAMGWQCSGCGEVFTLIGDSSKPQPIN